MAKIKVLSKTANPIRLIGNAAGVCYGKYDPDIPDEFYDSAVAYNKLVQRVDHCVRNGHGSVLEHAVVTFHISDISRACSHQIVRHRLASYSQQSQRYCKIDVDSDAWYVLPDWFDSSLTEKMNPDIPTNEQMFRFAMETCSTEYLKALAQGCRPEDARYMLPEATKTELVMTMNVRELFHFLDVRLDKRAQWEIRDVAQKMINAITEDDSVECDSVEWRHLMDIWKENR